MRRCRCSLLKTQVRLDQVAGHFLSTVGQRNINIEGGMLEHDESSIRNYCWSWLRSFETKREAHTTLLDCHLGDHIVYRTIKERASWSRAIFIRGEPHASSQATASSDTPASRAPRAGRSAGGISDQAC